MKKAIVILRKDTKGEYRIQVKDARNGKILFASSEGYKNRAQAVRNLVRIYTILGAALVCDWGKRGKAVVEISA